MRLLRVICSNLVPRFVLLVHIVRLGLLADLLRLPRGSFVLIDTVLRSVLGESLLLNELGGTRLVVPRVLPFVVHNHDFLSFLRPLELLLGQGRDILLVSRVWTSAHVAERHIRVQGLLRIIRVLISTHLASYSCQSTGELLLRFLVSSINNGRRHLGTFLILIRQPILLRILK